MFGVEKSAVTANGNIHMIVEVTFLSRQDRSS